MLCQITNYNNFSVRKFDLYLILYPKNRFSTTQLTLIFTIVYYEINKVERNISYHVEDLVFILLSNI